MSEAASHSIPLEAAADRPPRLATWFALWGVLWLAPFALFSLVLVPQGFGFFGRSWVSGLLFLLAAGGGLAFYRDALPKNLADARPGTRPVVAVLASLAITGVVYAWATATLPISAETWEQYRAYQLGLIRMDAVYLAKKLPELIFQQALIYVLVRHLQARGLSGWSLIGAFALLFGAIHTPLIAIKGWVGVPFVLLSASAALVFVPLIVRFRGGVAYSFCAHLLAYVIAGVGLRALG